MAHLGRASDVAGNGTVIIGDYVYSVVGDVQVQNLARFQTKITTGDYSYDSDPTVSSYSMASFTGGVGSEHLKEGVDDDNYWTGTMETRFPNAITNNRKTYSFGPGEGVAKGIGDFPASAPQFHAVINSYTLAHWDKDAQEFVSIATLPVTPVGDGKAYEINEKFWIPLGSAGIAVYDPNSAGDIVDVTTHADIHAIGLTIYDNKLVAITTEGYLRIMKDDETWEPVSPLMKVPSGYKPRGVVTFLNQQGDNAVHVITDRDVWVYDRNNAVIMRSSLQFPPHPYQGRGFTVFRGDSMYVSVGIGIHGYNGSVINAMGPDYRYGLPSSLQGYITDLEQEYNGMFCLVQGASETSVDYQTMEITPATYQDDDAVFREVKSVSSLMRWNQMGWHPVWQSDEAAGLPTNVLVSAADNEYRVWWGYAGKMYTQVLNIGFFNAKVAMQVGSDEFNDRDTLTTGWFDADMKAFDKLASHIELRITDAFEDGSSLGEVQIHYQTDRRTAWTLLGTVDDVGYFALPFGVQQREDETYFSVGEDFMRIRWMITSHNLRDEDGNINPNVTPIIEAMNFKYIKLPLSQLSWNFTVDLAQTEGFSGQGNSAAAEYLEALAWSRQFTRFVHRDKEYRVRVAQTQATQSTGYDERSSMRVNVIEIKSGIYDGLEVPEPHE